MIAKSNLLGYRCTADDVYQEMECPFFKEDLEDGWCSGHRSQEDDTTEIGECHDSDAIIAIEIQRI